MINGDALRYKAVQSFVARLVGTHGAQNGITAARVRVEIGSGLHIRRTLHYTVYRRRCHMATNVSQRYRVDKLRVIVCRHVFDCVLQGIL